MKCLKYFVQTCISRNKIIQFQFLIIIQFFLDYKANNVTKEENNITETYEERKRHKYLSQIKEAMTATWKQENSTCYLPQVLKRG